MATPKQEKLIKLVLENIGISGNTKSLGELLRLAGYSEAICKNPYLIFESETIQEGIGDIVDELKKKRNQAIKLLTKEKLEEEKAKDLTDIIDKLTKNIQLLGGKPTEIIENDYSQLSDEELIRKTKIGSGIGKEGIGEKAS